MFGRERVQAVRSPNASDASDVTVTIENGIATIQCDVIAVLQILGRDDLYEETNATKLVQEIAEGFAV